MICSRRYGKSYDRRSKILKKIADGFCKDDLGNILEDGCKLILYNVDRRSENSPPEAGSGRCVSVGSS